MKFLCELFYWFFGVATCGYYTAITLNGCAQAPYLLALFLPLVLLPTVNAVLLWVTDRPAEFSKTTIYWLGTFNSISLVIAGFLTAVLSPLCLMAALGVGLLLFMFPPGSAIAVYYLCVALGPIYTTLAMRRRLKALPSANVAQWFPLSSCLAGLLCVILMSVFPVLLTSECENVVANGKMVPQGLLLLRALGNDNALLQACYGEMSHVPWFFGPVGDALDHGLPNVIQEPEAREIYYRVKGRPFNTVPRSQKFFQKDLGDFFLMRDMERDYAWDEDYPYYLDYSDHDFAGETVGGVVRGLSMTRSEMNAWFDADEAVSHMHWTMNFKVENGGNKEIRAQLLLPPHAVITGCTLWTKGVWHDSVIATRNSTRKAYTQSADAGEKPFLVSTAGAGRVLIQSPTGRWGTDAKMVVDITSPLVITKPEEAALLLPSFTERDFAIGSNHMVTISDKENSASKSKFEISDADLTQGKGVRFFKRNPSVRELFTQPSSAFPSGVHERLISKTFSPSYPTAIVLDGSAPMQGSMGVICDSLQKLKLTNASIIWASDRPTVLVSGVSTDLPDWKRALDRIRDSSCLGGQNNAEALSLSMSKFGEKDNLHIVWLHAGQPAKFSGADLLDQINKSPRKCRCHGAKQSPTTGLVTLYEYQVVPGPNETIKSLDQTSHLVQVPCMGTLSHDLDGLFDQLSGRKNAYEFVRDTASQGNQPGSLAKFPLELEQIFVANMIRLNAATPNVTPYGRLAEYLSLVTPLTNALVLENESDYAKYGVQKHSDKGYSPQNDQAPVQGMFGGIPIKPEPPLWLTMSCALIAGAVSAYVMRRKRRSA